MRLRFIQLFAAAAVSFSAPLAAGAQPAAALDPQAPPLSSVWAVASDNSARHLASGLRCPAKLDDMQRTSAFTYDELGLDVSCGYATNGIIVTVYATALQLNDQVYDSAKQEIIVQRKALDPRLIAEERVNRGGFEWRRAAYSFRDGLVSELWLAQSGRWTVEYRVTYKASEVSADPPAVASLTSLLNTTLVAQNQLCDRAAPTKRDGQLSNDEQVRMAAAIMGGLAAQAADRGEQIVEKDEITYCPEAALSANETRLLILRGLTNKGGDAEVDRVNAAGSELVAITEPDGALNYAQNERGSGAPKLWTTTSTKGQVVTTYIVYKGRPSIEDLARTYKMALDGNIHPLSVSDPSKKRLTIDMPKK